jgi:hypothetical protein
MKTIRPTVKQTLNLFSEIESGKDFTVTFVKKDNTVREMNCRRNERAYLKGGLLKYNAIGRGLYPVFDADVKEYRMINLRTIITISLGNKLYRFRRDPKVSR